MKNSFIICNLVFMLFFVFPASSGRGETAQSRHAASVQRSELLKSSREDVLKLAQKYTDNGDYASAKLCYQVLVSRNAADTRSWLLMGMLQQHHLDDIAGAVLTFRRAQRFIPENQIEQKAYAHRLTAEAYRFLGESRNSIIYYAQAIHEYEDAIRYEPKSSELRYLLGVCRLNSQNYETAVKDFEKSIQLDSKSEWAKLSRKGIGMAKEELRKRR